MVATMALSALAVAAAAHAPWWMLAAGALAGAGAVIVAAAIQRRSDLRGERRREGTEAALRLRAERSGAAAERLENLFGALDQPILASDAAGTIVLWNRAAERLLGIPASKALGRPIEEVFTQADLVRIHSATREGRSVREQVPVSRPDGPRVWEIAAAPVRQYGTERVQTAEDGAGMFPVVMELRDVTEQARSLQVRADFVANASHELRTPIASMRIALETLAGLGEEDAPMRDRLMSMLSGNVARLEEMVRDLLDLSRLESPEAALRIEPVPGSELARSLSDDFAHACRQRSLILAFDFDPALEALRTDRKLLGLILGNLIDNATKFAFEGTEIRVVGRPADSNNGAARGVRLEIIDRGVGIPLNQQSRVFERYYQVDQARDGGRVRRGTGLGLAIVKHAVRRLGGTIRVNSVWQQGTTMVVELPACLPPGVAVT